MPRTDSSNSPEVSVSMLPTLFRQLRGARRVCQARSARLAKHVRERVTLASALERDDIIAGRRMQIAELRSAGVVAGIWLVGREGRSVVYLRTDAGDALCTR